MIQNSKLKLDRVLLQKNIASGDGAVFMGDDAQVRQQQETQRAAVRDPMQLCSCVTLC